VTLVAFNDSAQTKSVAIEAALPGGWWTGPDVRSIGPDEKGRCQRLKLPLECKHEGGKAVGTLQLPAYATASVNFRLDSFAQPGRTLARQESFGDRTLQFLKGTEPVAVTIAGPKTAPARAWLRVGLLGVQPEDKVTANLNGIAIPLQPTALQEIPLDLGALKETNQLEVKLAQPSTNSRLALGFAALIFETVR
ncbi:MAG: hypothetical protein WCP21_01400, partial [Armatimonadota bacterium]